MKICSIEQLKPYVEYLKEFNLKRIKIGDFEAEFDVHLSLLKQTNPASLEPPTTDELLNTAKVSLKEALQNEQDALFWSAPDLQGPRK